MIKSCPKNQKNIPLIGASCNLCGKASQAIGGPTKLRKCGQCKYVAYCVSFVFFFKFFSVPNLLVFRRQGGGRSDGFHALLIKIFKFIFNNRARNVRGRIGRVRIIFSYFFLNDTLYTSRPFSWKDA